MSDVSHVEDVSAEAPDTSIRGELAAALVASQLDAPDTPSTPSVEPVAAPETPQPAQTASERERDEAGRFAKAAKAAQASPKTEPLTPGAVAEPAQPRTSAPPPSLKAAAKAEWDKFPPSAREELWRIEDSAQQAKAEWSQKAERLNRLDQVLAPRSERLKIVGLDEVQAIQALFAAQDFLERDPYNALAYLARQSGVDFRQFAQAMAGQQAQQPQLDPTVKALMQKVQTLESGWTQQQQAAEQAQVSVHVDHVQRFAADPANLYFENVKDRMATLLRSAPPESKMTLADAYEQAVWSDPEIRPVLLSKQQADQQAQAQAAARAKVSQAQHASGSVIGSPTPGAVQAGAPSATLRDELERNFQAAS